MQPDSVDPVDPVDPVDADPVTGILAAAAGVATKAVAN